ncbi:MAG: tetratricopeptide repeat protein, partial [Planctomycetia bacterium]|nr:tetratricopeptide repeat protein [Planctomycetia bacterium]
YVMQVHCPGAGEAGAADVTVVDHVKLFRNLPELRFEGRLHEQILPAIRRLGGTVAWTDVFVVHSGYDHSPEGQEQKKQRDLRLLHLELQEQPEHPFTLFNLGMTYADLGEYEQAVEFLQRSLALSGEGDSHLRKVYALLVYCSAQLGRADEAGEICAAGLRRFPEDTELHFRRGLLLQQRGRLPEAVAAYQRVLERRGERYFSSLDRGLHGFKTRQNLAVTYAELGDLARAEEQWRRVVAEVPQYRPGWQGLGDVLLAQARYAEIAQLAERLRGDAQLRAAGSILQGRLAIVRGELAQARAVLGGAVRETPEDAELWEHWCRFLFEHGEAEETARALQELLHRVPEDAAALHNLGAIYCRQGRRRQAAEMLRQSLRLRPNAPHTRALLQTVADPAD